MSTFHEFFDGVLQGLGLSRKTSLRRKNPQERNKRSLQLEPLENRELLSVSPPELYPNVWIEKIQDADENGQFGIFRVYRDDTRSALTVNYQLEGGTATLGSDYSPSYFYLPGFDTATKKGTVSFAAGSASADITIVPVDDTLIEGTETVIVSLSPYSGTLYMVDETRQTATLEIFDNDVAPKVWIEKIQDADESGQNGIFRVYRDDTRNALTVSYQLDGGTATPDADYYANWIYLPGYDTATKKGTVSFSAGSASVDITIYPIDDSLIEGTETVVVSLSPYSGTLYTVDATRQTASLDIFDNDVAPKVWIEKIQDAAEGGQSGIFRVHRDDTRNALTVGYQWDGGTATLDADYYSYLLPGFNATTKKGTVSFGAGTAHIDITVYPLDDTLIEGMEMVIFSLSPYSGPLYTVDETRQTATLDIFDNDIAPTVWIEKIQDAAEGGQSGIFRVYRTDTRNALAVAYQLDGGTATLDADYYSYLLPGFNATTKKGTVAFGAGVAHVDITVYPIDDTLVEGTETVILSLSPYSEPLYTVDVTRQTATLNIHDNDVAPKVWIERVRDADATGAQSGLFRIYRDDAAVPLTIGYELQGGTAMPGVDFQANLPGFNAATNKGTVTFAANVFYVDIPIALLGPVSAGDPKTVTIAIAPPTSGNTSYTLDTPRQMATLGIPGDILAKPTVWIERLKDAAEGGQSGVFRLYRDDTRSSLTVAYEWVGGTATLGTDYSNSASYLPGFNATTKKGTVTFAAGKPYVDLTIFPADDALIEGTETVTFALSSYTGTLYAVDENRQTATLDIIDNDVAPNVWIERIQDAAEGGQSGVFRIYRNDVRNSLTVNYEWVGGTATLGTDYSNSTSYLPGFNATTKTGTVTFSVGKSYVDLTINPNDDASIEETETATFALSPYAGTLYTVDETRHTATLDIFDNDVAPNVWIERIRDAAEGGQTGIFRIYRDDTRNSLTVGYEWVGGTATLGSDYSSSTSYLPGLNTTTKKGTVTFSAGKSYMDIVISATDDALIEGTETATFALSPYSDDLYKVDEARQEATLSIFDNDVAPNVWIERIQDAAEAGQTGIFRIYRNDVRNALTVGYELTGGTATLGSDYSSSTSYLPGFSTTTKKGSMTFSAGKSYVDIVISAMDDVLIEGTESMTFSLSPYSDGLYTVDQTRWKATLSIFDNDVAPNVWIERVQDAVEVERKGGFRIYRDDVRNALTVDYEWAGGTATLGTDYSSTMTYLPGFNATTKKGTVTFAAGKSYVDLIINPIDDGLIEETETVIFALSSYAGTLYKVDETRNSATLNIYDDMRWTVAVEKIADGAERTAGEEQQPGRFKISRAHGVALDKPLTVSFTLSGTATYGDDYVSVPAKQSGLGVIPWSVTIPAGEIFAYVDVNVIDDFLVESDETVILTLGTSSDYNLNAAAKMATMMIFDNDAKWTVGVEKISDGAERTADEEQQPGRFKISRASGSGLDRPLVVSFKLTGTATFDSDYTTTPAVQSSGGTIYGSVTIPAGAMFAYVDVNVIDDFLVEGNETVILTLDTSTPYDLNTAAKTATINIVDNDDKWTVAVEKVADGAETLPGETPQPGRFKISRTSGTGMDQPQTIGFKLSGTATYGEDYVTVPASQSGWGILGSVTIPAGETFAYVDVNVIDDRLYESTETVILTLDTSSAYNLNAAAKTATVNIVDNDIKWTVAVEKIADGAERTADEEQQPGRFKVSRAHGTGVGQPLTVSFTLLGTAIYNSDYTTSPACQLGWNAFGSVTIPAGELFAYVDVNVIDDFLYESDETVILTLETSSGYNLNGAATSATVNILDNDVKWTVAVEKVADGAERTVGEEQQPGRFKITRADGTGLDRPLAVNYTLTGTAICENGFSSSPDYRTNPASRFTWEGSVGSVTIPAGETFAYVDVDVIDDFLYESDETVILTLDSSSNYNLSAAAKIATATIFDNDVKWTVGVEKVADGAERTADEEQQTGRFKISRADGTGLDRPLTINYTLTGTATYDNGFAGLPDYATSPASRWVWGGDILGSVTIPAGELFAYVDVNVIDDFEYESTETVILTLDSSSGYNLNAAANSATVNITDNDVKWDVRVEKAADGAERTADEEQQPGRFKIVRENGTGASQPLTIYFTLSGTATHHSDYTTNPASSGGGLFSGDVTGSVTIPAGKLFAYVDVNVIDDAAIEPTETAILMLSSSGGYNLNDSAKTAMLEIIDNDIAPHVWIESTRDGAEGGEDGYFILRRDNTQNPLHVSIDISGTASNAVDYTYIGSTVTFTAGEESVMILVCASEDQLVEQPLETVVLTIGSCKPGNIDQYILDDTPEHPKSATIMIADGDIAPTVHIDSVVDAIEGGASGKFALKCDNTRYELTVGYYWGGTAASSVDYESLSGFVTFEAGSDTAEIAIIPIEDTVLGTDRNVILTLGAPTIRGGVAQYALDSDQSEATLWIFENGTTPNVWIESKQDGEEGGQNGYFRLRRDNTQNPLTVEYAVGGTATNGVDYSLLSDSVTFESGQEFIDILIDVTDDSLVERAETVIMTLKPRRVGGVEQYTLPGTTSQPSTEMIVIIDNDGEMEVFAGGPYVLNEGETLTLNASKICDPFNSGAWTYLWDLDDDGIFGESGSEALYGNEIGEMVLFTAEQLSGAMTKTVKVQATDDQGHTVVASAEVRVLKAALKIILTPPAEANPGQPILWTGSFSGLGSGPWTASVNFGDGTPTEAIELQPDKTFSFEHAYAYKGNYTIALTIDNGEEAVEETYRTTVGQLTPEEMDFEGPILTPPTVDELEASLTDNIIPMLQPAAYSVYGGSTLAGASVLENLVNGSMLDVSRFGVQIAETLEHGTFVFLADGSFTYLADDDYLGEEIIRYDVLNENGEKVNSGILAIQIIPSSMEGTAESPLPDGYYVDPESDDFGVVSIGGQGFQPDSYDIFAPTMLQQPNAPMMAGSSSSFTTPLYGLMASSEMLMMSSLSVGQYGYYGSAAHTVNKPIATFDGQTRGMDGIETIYVKIAYIDLGNGNWKYSEIFCSSYNYWNGTDQYSGSVIYVLNAAVIDGEYGMDFFQMTTDSYLAVRESGTGRTTYSGAVIDTHQIAHRSNPENTSGNRIETKSHQDIKMQSALESHSGTTGGGKSYSVTSGSFAQSLYTESQIIHTAAFGDGEWQVIMGTAQIGLSESGNSFYNWVSGNTIERSSESYSSMFFIFGATGNGNIQGPRNGSGQFMVSGLVGEQGFESHVSAAVRSGTTETGGNQWLWSGSGQSTGAFDKFFSTHSTTSSVTTSESTTTTRRTETRSTELEHKDHVTTYDYVQNFNGSNSLDQNIRDAGAWSVFHEKRNAHGSAFAESRNETREESSNAAGKLVKSTSAVSSESTRTWYSLQSYKWGSSVSIATGDAGTENRKSQTNNSFLLREDTSEYIRGLISGDATTRTSDTSTYSLSTQSKLIDGAWRQIWGEGQASNYISRDYVFTGRPRNTSITFGDTTTNISYAGNKADGNSISSDFIYTWNAGKETWDTSGTGSSTAYSSLHWLETRAENTKTPVFSSTKTFSLLHDNAENLLVEYVWDNTKKSWTLDSVKGGGGGRTVTDSLTISSSKGNTLAYTRNGFPASGGYPYDPNDYDNDYDYYITKYPVEYNSHSSTDDTHSEQWNIDYILYNGAVKRLTSGKITDENAQTSSISEQGSGHFESHSRTELPEGECQPSIFKDPEDCYCHQGEYYVTKSYNDYSRDWSFTNSAHSSEKTTIVTDWRYSPDGTYSATGKADSHIVKGGTFSRTDNHSNDGSQDYHYWNPWTRMAGGLMFSWPNVHSSTDSYSGDWSFEQMAKATGTDNGNGGTFRMTDINGHESGHTSSSQASSGITDDNPHWYPHLHRSYNSTSRSEREFDVKWSGVPIVYDGYLQWESERHTVLGPPEPIPGPFHEESAGRTPLPADSWPYPADHTGFFPSQHTYARYVNWGNLRKPTEVPVGLSVVTPPPGTGTITVNATGYPLLP